MVLSCAVLIVGTGCTAEEGTDELPAPATLPAASTPAASTPAASTPAASTPVAPTPPGQAEATDAPVGAEPGSDPTAGQDNEYTETELEMALSAVDEQESLAGVILNDSAIRELVNGSDEGTSDLTVTPEECDVFADPNLASLARNATLGVMTFAGASSLQPDSLSLTSQESDESVQEQIQANRSQLAECSAFDLEIGGEAVAVAVTELAASTSADETFAVRTVVQIPGTIQETVSLTALIGTTTINVTIGSSGDIAQDLARGESLVDTTIAALQSL
ncbi:hypothetical protein GCM10009582_18970 [Arthrobacter flavus]